MIDWAEVILAVIGLFSGIVLTVRVTLPKAIEVMATKTQVDAEMKRAFIESAASARQLAESNEKQVQELIRQGERNDVTINRLQLVSEQAIADATVHLEHRASAEEKAESYRSQYETVLGVNAELRDVISRTLTLLQESHERFEKKVAEHARLEGRLAQIEEQHKARENAWKQERQVLLDRIQKLESKLAETIERLESKETPE